MQIHDVLIENFRGIKQMEWRPGSGVTALVGPGDSGKTTILDALGLLFSPRWSHTFTDNDFHSPSAANAGLLIQATVIDPPAELLGLDAFMNYVRGVNPTTGVIVDEPDTETPALTIELRVDRYLEPTWQVVADRQSIPGVLRASHRAAFGVMRVGSDDVTDLRWSRNSALLRMTGAEDQRPTGQTLIEASRAAKNATVNAFHELTGIADKVKVQARLLRGIRAEANLSAALNADSFQLGEGAVSLHSGEVPMERHGLGSRRLTGIAVQMANSEDARVLLVDEVESGLEPFRIRHLLRALELRTSDKSPLTQVFVTTHSPVVLRELKHSNLAVVRNEPHRTQAVVPGSAFQGALRKNAEAFLAPFVLICEGATEAGFARGVYAHAEGDNLRLITAVATADAGGEGNLVPYAAAFADLGYRTAVFCDNDTNTDLSALPPSTTLIRCDESKCTEQQIIESLSVDGLRRVLEHGMANSSHQAVTAAVAARGCPASVSGRILRGEAVSDAQLDDLRSALGSLAKKEGATWFKSTSGGELFAEIALADSQAIRADSTAARIVRELLAWGASV
ncbi:ATP-dependent endonuclease [Arthrobacter sp. NPDC056886]|uniref:ATP-dependent nuclease n=1 Tax=Arthrobacter sp. NPDC056886 TaxID=3345960 RepID=UPI00366C72E4